MPFPHRRQGLPRELRQFVFNSSLTLLFVGLFVASLVGQVVTGYLYYNQQLSDHGMPGVDFWQWLGTGTFLNSAFVNWQAAVLQLTILILAGAFLHQRGASHSRRPEEDEQPDHVDSKTPAAGQAGWWRRNSLFLGFLALFLVFFAVHAFTSQRAANETRALSRMSAEPLSSYVLSSQFWFENFQTWEAEFVTIAFFLVLTVFLREQGSPESKRVAASDRETGDTYE